MAFGASAVLLARDYPFGSTFKMGPGYFPTVLGVLLVLVGLVVTLRGLLQPGTAVGAFAWRQRAATLLEYTFAFLAMTVKRGVGELEAIF